MPGEQWNVPVCMCGMKKKRRKKKGEGGREGGRDRERELMCAVCRMYFSQFQLCWVTGRWGWLSNVPGD